MRERSASVPHANSVASRPGALGAVAAALLASIIAGLTGLVLVFGSSLTEAPANAFIVAGLFYAIVPGLPSLLAIDRLLARWRAGKTRNLVIFVALSAIVAVVGFCRFWGCSSRPTRRWPLPRSARWRFTMLCQEPPAASRSGC